MDSCGSLETEVTLEHELAMVTDERVEDYSGALVERIASRLPAEKRMILKDAVEGAGLPLALFDGVDDDTEVDRIFSMLRKLVAEDDPKKRVSMAERVAHEVGGWGGTTRRLQRTKILRGWEKPGFAESDVAV